jgi:tetratricopeptide (TPR) repeat protein
MKDSDLTFDANFHVQKYIKGIVQNLSDPAFDLAQYISLLSITKAFIQVGDVYKVIKYATSSLIELENNALIEYDRIQKTIKMHELFRDYINTEFININQQKIEIIYEAINPDRLFERAYYLLLIQNKEGREHHLITAINNAVDNENYSFLILMGEHFKLMYNFEPAKACLHNDTFIKIIWGYLEGLIGIGNYPAAQEVIDSCKLVVRDPENLLQFELSLLIANLHHLQIQYELSINAYEVLLSYTNLDEFKQYRAKCLKGIAHSYRHEGKYPMVAIEYYNKAISEADVIGQKSISLACKQEILTLNLALDRINEAKDIYDKLDREINLLPEDQYIFTKISYAKVKARFLRFQKCPEYNLKEFTLLNQVLIDYRTMKKRLQYNTYFELGEYYRLQGKYSVSIDHYNTALVFSKRNLDYNLESMCVFGIILCEIASNSCLYYESNLKQKQTLITIIDKCAEYNLYYNTLIAELLLAKISQIQIDKSVILSFKIIGYPREVIIAETDTYQRMMLTLM